MSVLYDGGGVGGLPGPQRPTFCPADAGPVSWERAPWGP